MKVFSAIAAASAIASVSAVTPLSDSQYKFLFSNFVEKYDKMYQSNNVNTKFNIFKDNLDYIREHNANGDDSYTLGINEFADLTTEEFAERLNMNLALDNEFQEFQGEESAELSSVGAPFRSVDWSAKISNPVKNQGSCGSCWAFSTIGAFEYRHAIKRGASTATRFSEQQLVDCDNVNNACQGGLMKNAFAYIKNAGGVCTQGSYPYTGKKEACKATRCGAKTALKSVSLVTGGAGGLANAVAAGPVTVAVQASTQPFQFYKSGILKTSACGTGLNHAVLAVGTGNTGGVNYFKLRNSWGAGWGASGNILIADDNTCGLIDSVNRGYDYIPVF